MLNSPYFEKMEGFVSQVGRLFCAADAAALTGVPRSIAYGIIRYMANEGMLIRLAKTERTQYYRYNESLDIAAWYAKQKREIGKQIMRDNSDKFHQILSDVMPSRNSALFPEIKVQSCPKCSAHYDRCLEPYIISVEPDVPGVGLKCPECGYSVEWVMANALPLPCDSFNACIGAISQLVKVAWYRPNRMDVGWRDQFELLKEWAPVLKEMLMQADALAGGTHAKS